MLEWFGRIEEIPGIGEKTAWKIREHFLNFMREKRGWNESTLEQNNTAANHFG
jgi:ERCC4-type nuclease